MITDNPVHAKCATSFTHTFGDSARIGASDFPTNGVQRGGMTYPETKIFILAMVPYQSYKSANCARQLLQLKVAAVQATPWVVQE